MFSPTFRPLTKNNYGFSELEHFLGPLYHVCTHIHCISIHIHLIESPTMLHPNIDDDWFMYLEFMICIVQHALIQIWILRPFISCLFDIDMYQGWGGLVR